MSHVSPAVGVGLVCALLSALGTNLAFLFKHRGALAAPDVATDSGETDACKSAYCGSRELTPAG